MQTTKTCSKCKLPKLAFEFDFRKKHQKGGLNSWCRKCRLECSRIWRTKNLVWKRERDKRWRLQNIKKLKTLRRRAYLKNIWGNKKRYNKWCLKNRERCRYYSKKARSTIQGRLNYRMAGAIGRALKGNKKGQAWESLVDFTIVDLQNHIKNKFTKGMTWKIFMKGKIHIDHITPKSRFHYVSTNDPEFKKCWSLSNLQPLWEKDNLSKGNKTMEEWIATTKED